MNIKLVLSLIALILGSWFIFDSITVLSTNFYFGGNEPGRWADVLREAGIDPFEFAPGFLALGGLWFTSLITMVMSHKWWRTFYGATALLTIWYLPFGTLLSLVSLVLLIALGSERPARRRIIVSSGSVLSVLATFGIIYTMG